MPKPLYQPRAMTTFFRDAKLLTLDAAKHIAAAAETEAVRNGWTVAIAVVDASGDLMLFHRIDDTQGASVEIAIGKARTAVRFKRPTKALEDAVTKGRTVMLSLERVVLMEGGLPIVVDGRVVGGVGVSGVTSQQDAQVAAAGVAALAG